jgi:predicted transcriptional regulator
MTRRASLFGGRRRSPGNGSDSADSIEEDPEFKEQVDKLADLLPQAERAVLARYLRRAGSDLNAIGQYLEDEKNGTLQMD